MRKGKEGKLQELTMTVGDYFLQTFKKDKNKFRCSWREQNPASLGLSQTPTNGFVA